MLELEIGDRWALGSWTHTASVKSCHIGEISPPVSRNRSVRGSARFPSPNKAWLVTALRRCVSGNSVQEYMGKKSSSLYACMACLERGRAPKGVKRHRSEPLPERFHSVLKNLLGNGLATVSICSRYAPFCTCLVTRRRNDRWLHSAW
jgi:hypothetical protein